MDWSRVDYFWSIVIINYFNSLSDGTHPLVSKWYYILAHFIVTKCQHAFDELDLFLLGFNVFYTQNIH